MSVAYAGRSRRDQRSLKGFRVTLVFKEPALLAAPLGALEALCSFPFRTCLKRFREEES